MSQKKLGREKNYEKNGFTLWGSEALGGHNPRAGEDQIDFQLVAAPLTLSSKHHHSCLEHQLAPLKDHWPLTNPLKDKLEKSSPEAGAPSNTLCTALIRCATLKFTQFSCCSIFDYCKLALSGQAAKLKSLILRLLLWTFLAISLWASLSLAVEAGMVPTARTSWDTEGRSRSSSYCTIIISSQLAGRFCGRWVKTQKQKQKQDGCWIWNSTWTEASSLVASKDPTLLSMLMNW